MTLKTLKEIGKERDKKFADLMEAICEFGRFEATAVWDSSLIFGNTTPNIKFIGDMIIELSKYDKERQEAIKWIKNWEKIDAKVHANEIYAFKVFFNISEKDLEEQDD
jgi:hypothetical protein